MRPVGWLLAPLFDQPRVECSRQAELLIASLAVVVAAVVVAAGLLLSAVGHKAVLNFGTGVLPAELGRQPKS